MNTVAIAHSEIVANQLIYLDEPVLILKSILISLESMETSFIEL